MKLFSKLFCQLGTNLFIFTLAISVIKSEHFFSSKLITEALDSLFHNQFKFWV